VSNFKKYINVALNHSVLTNVWAFVHFLRRKIPLDYYFGGGYSFFPDFVTILITLRCNLKCEGCSSGSPQATLEFKEKGLKELTTEEIKKFIDQISFFRPAIYFNGGEPTLRGDLFELLSYAKKKKLVTAFTTNGTFLNEKIIGNILDSRLDFFSISIDGPAEFHDKKRGLPGTFDKAVRGLKLLLEERTQRKLRLPHIRIASIFNPENFDNSKYILNLAQELKVDELAFGYLMFYTPKAEKRQKIFIKKHKVGGNHMIGLGVKDDYEFRFDDDEVKQFFELVKKSPVPVAFVPPKVEVEKFFNPKLSPSKRSKCLSPWFTSILMPNGDISPCQGYVVGNIKKQSFWKLWNNEKIRTFRKTLKQSPFPACFRCGEGQDIRFD